MRRRSALRLRCAVRLAVASSTPYYRVILDRIEKRAGDMNARQRGMCVVLWYDGKEGSKAKRIGRVEVRAFGGGPLERKAGRVGRTIAEQHRERELTRLRGVLANRKASVRESAQRNDNGKA